MHISEKIKEYLSDSKVVCESNIIITDLKSIRLIEPFNSNSDIISSNDTLSNDILTLIQKWNSHDINKSNLFCIMNYYCLDLIEDDNNNYSAQMIFPLYNDKNNELLGLIIFCRTNKNYIFSSTNPISTTVKFINEFLNEEN